MAKTVSTVLLTALLCAGMLLPFLPGHRTLIRNDRRRTRLPHPHWITILFD